MIQSHPLQHRGKHQIVILQEWEAACSMLISKQALKMIGEWGLQEWGTSSGCKFVGEGREMIPPSSVSYHVIVLI